MAARALDAPALPSSMAVSPAGDVDLQPLPHELPQPLRPRVLFITLEFLGPLFSGACA
jgi:hypothetical protein